METKIDTNEYEVRVLNLKKWNLPQCMPLRDFDIRSEAPVNRYVSCQSYHFVEVSAPNKNPGFIRSAYDEIIEKIRKPEQTNKVEANEIHTVQSAVMLGKKNNFWEKDTSHVYITFIQLTNSEMWDFDSLEKGISDIIEEQKKNANNENLEWCMYYSLDFCDLILFTKNVTYSTYFDILWALVPYRKKGLHQIRDTFSMLCFEYGYIKRAFDDIDSDEEPMWDDELGLVLRMSLQSKSSVDRIQEFMHQFADKSQQYRIPGRYDLMYIFSKLNGSSILKILHYLDKQTSSKGNDVLAGYDIIFLADPSSSTAEDVNAPCNHYLLKTASQLLGYLCEVYCSSETLHANYAVETSKALQGLMKQGFSDEFVVSVLPSFIAYLNTCITIDKHAESKEEIITTLNRLKYRYFGAVNTLSLCTMHTERQFVQAPAYNATYFDVPPKMLAFYAAIAHEISQKMDANDSPQYNFIIIPDYRKDIYVKALTTDKKIAGFTPDHIAVVYLNEQYFYDPVKAVKLLAHEIGHYVGDRKREKRSEFIFKALSLHILQHTPLFNLIPDDATCVRENSLLSILTTSLGEYMLAAYKEWGEKHGVLFHRIDDVAEFLNEHDWGYSFFLSNSSARLHTKWYNTLQTALQTDIDVKEDYRTAIEGIEYTLQTDYFTDKCCTSNDTVRMLVSTIIRQVQMAPHVVRKRKKINIPIKGSIAFGEVGQEIIQAFREAYADLRMIQISSINKCEYNELFNDICTVKSIERELRHDAVCMACYKQNNAEELNLAFIGKDFRDLIAMTTIAQYIKDYLDICKDDLSGTGVSEVIRVFSEKNTVEQAKLIHRKIFDYKKNVCKMCQELYEEKTQMKPALCRTETCDVCRDSCNRVASEYALSLTR